MKTEMNEIEHLPKEIIKSTELTPSEKIIYLHLFHISGWDEDKVINKSQIAEKLGIERKTLQRAFKKFEFLELIKLNEDNTFELHIANKMLGDFVKVPTQFLYDTNLTPAERLVEMVLFDFYFIIDSKGNFVNKSNVKFQTIATIYNMSEQNISKHLRNIKAKGAIDYTVHTSNGKSKVYGFKFFKQKVEEKTKAISISTQEIEERTKAISISTQEFEDIVEQIPLEEIKELLKEKISVIKAQNEEIKDMNKFIKYYTD